MKPRLPFIMVVCLLTACSPILPAYGGERTISPGASPAESSAGAGTAVGEAPSRQGGMPLGITAQPPRIPIEPIQATELPPGVIPPPPPLQGWQTFTSASLGISIVFPPDWSAAEKPGDVIFTSPQGVVVRLQLMSISGGGGGTPGQACNLLVNTYGVSVEVCGGGASDRYQADFHVLKADGSVEDLQLSTTDSRALDVYKAMLNSLHPG